MQIPQGTQLIDGFLMTNDPRCCGTDTCLINPDGECWCGQKWDGEKMSYPSLDKPDADGNAAADAERE